MKLIYFYFIVFIISISSCSSKQTRGRIPASEAPIQIVFDLDYTIVQPGRDISDLKTVKVDEEIYRISDWAVEMIEKLEAKNVEIYFFSGGSEERNITLLKKIKSPQGRSLNDLASGVFSYSDLREVSSTGSFTERLKKDLQVIGLNLDRAILIDDNLQFAYQGQDRNMLWMGKTYHFYNNFPQTYNDLNSSTVAQEFIPRSSKAWFIARNKLKFIYELLKDAIDSDKNSDIDFLDYINQNKDSYIPYQESYSQKFKKLYLRSLHPQKPTCHGLALEFKR